MPLQNVAGRLTRSTYRSVVVYWGVWGRYHDPETGRMSCAWAWKLDCRWPLLAGLGESANWLFWRWGVTCRQRPHGDSQFLTVRGRVENKRIINNWYFSWVFCTTQIIWRLLYVGVTCSLIILQNLLSSIRALKHFLHDLPNQFIFWKYHKSYATITVNRPTTFADICTCRQCG